MTVTCVDDAPVAVNDSATVLEDSGATAINVLANDTDIDGGPKSIASVTQPANGTVVITGGGTGLTYTPNANYCNNPPGTALSTFTYTLAPGGSTATVTVTVTCQNDPPVAQNKTGIAVQANMKRVGINAGLLVGVTDADNGVSGCTPNFSVASITSVSGGTVSNVNLGAGTFDFDSTPGFTGTAVVNYTVADDGCPGPAATSAPATISLTVSGPVIWFVNSAGAAGNGTLSSPFNTLAAAVAVDAANHGIFLYTGTYSTGITLNTGELLIGQGVTGASFDAVFGITPPAGTIARPTIGGTRPTVQGTVALGASSTVRGLNLTTSASTGLSGGAVASVTVNEVSITTTTGTTVNLNGTNGALSFTSLTSTGASTGLSLTSTGGSFTVTGDGTGRANGSGGSLSNSTFAAMTALTSSGTISLNSMNVSITIAANHGVLFDNNAGGTLAGNITGCTFTGVGGAANVSQNKSMLQFEAGNTAPNAANVTANVQNSFFFNNRTYGMFTNAAGDAIMNVTLNQSGFGTDVNTGAAVNNPGTTITNAPPFSLGITNGSNAKVTYNVTNNTFWGARGLDGAIYAVTISGASTVATSLLNGTFSGNRIGKAGVLGSGCTGGCAGLGLLPGTQGAFNPTVTNNDIRQVNSVGINFQNTVGTGATFTSSAKFKGNTLTEPDTTGAPLFQRALTVSPINSGGSNTTVCAEIGGAGVGEPNIISGAWSAGNFIRVTNLANTIALRLPGYGGAATDAAAVNAFISGRNGGAATNSTTGALGFAGGAACP